MVSHTHVYDIGGPPNGAVPGRRGLPAGPSITLVSRRLVITQKSWQRPAVHAAERASSAGVAAVLLAPPAAASTVLLAPPATVPANGTAAVGGAAVRGAWPASVCGLNPGGGGTSVCRLCSWHGGRPAYGLRPGGGGGPSYGSHPGSCVGHRIWRAKVSDALAGVRHGDVAAGSDLVQKRLPI